MADVGAVHVLVVDDHLLVRQGTRDILERDPTIEVVGEAATGEEAVVLVESLEPDVVLMDVGLPGIGGVEATERIRDARPRTRVLALTVHDDDEYVFGMLDAGASGYLLKDVRDRELLAAVHTVATGESVLDPAVTRTVLGRLRTRSVEPKPGSTLTAREVGVLQLVADGLENAEIADRLHLSPRTVEVHLGNLFRKLGVRSRTEAVMAGLRVGVIVVSEG